MLEYDTQASIAQFAYMSTPPPLQEPQDYYTRAG